MEKVKTKYLSTTKYVLVRTNPLVSLAKLNRIEIFLLRHLIDRYRWKKSEMAKCLNCNIRCPRDGQCRQITTTHTPSRCGVFRTSEDCELLWKRIQRTH